MSAEADSFAYSLGHCLGHYQGVSGVKTTGDIGRFYDLKKQVIATYLVGTETFPQIGIQVDLHCLFSSFTEKSGFCFVQSIDDTTDETGLVHLLEINAMLCLP